MTTDAMRLLFTAFSRRRHSNVRGQWASSGSSLGLTQAPGINGRWLKHIAAISAALSGIETKRGGAAGDV